MRQMILQLLAFAQQAQVFLRPFEMVFYVLSRPLIVGMLGYTIAHHGGDYLKRLFEWFH